MKLSVVVPVWNQSELVLSCLRSVEAALTSVADAELIVVDDGSTDGIAERVEREIPRARVLCLDGNHGFAVATNRGVRATTGEYLLLLNSDTVVAEEALATLLEFLETHAEYDGVAPRLVGADGRTQRSCMAFPRFTTPLFFGSPLERMWPESPELRRYFLRDFDHESERDIEQPPAACWLVRRSSWQKLGEFDESLELFFNDVDWCRRLAQRGGKLRYLPSATIVHLGGASTCQRTDLISRWHTDRLRYQRKHHGALGALLVKSCVSWTWLDWSVQNVWKRLSGRPAENAAPLRRAFAAFLRS